MTKEQINVAIAEWLGVNYHKPTPGELKSGSYYQYEPNYYSDLNAIHEAEKSLVPKEIYKAGEPLTKWFGYREHLINICSRTETAPMHATAPQRCEALLRTIGKWVEQ